MAGTLSLGRPQSGQCRLFPSNFGLQGTITQIGFASIGNQIRALPLTGPGAMLDSGITVTGGWGAQTQLPGVGIRVSLGTKKGWVWKTLALEWHIPIP